MKSERKQKRLLLRATVIGIIVLALGGALVSAFINDDAPVRIGEAAPDFSLTNLEGETVQLSDYQGQGVFINFWATWCGPCKEEMPAMQSQYEQYQDEGIEILAVNIAESELVASRFVERLGLTFPVVLDSDRTVTRQYEVGDIPSSYFIDPQGNVAANHTGMLSEQEIKEYLDMIRP